MRGINNQGHGCLTPTLQSDTGSYLTALPCSVCLRHSPAPFPRSTTHTKTHAWSPPPPLLPLLVRGEREAESSEERTLVELYEVRQSKHRPLEISRRICFLTSLLYHVSCYFTWGSLLSPVQVMTSRHPQPIKSLGTHGQKGHVYSPPWHPFNKTTFFTKNCLYFTFQFLFCCRTPCNACKTGFI